MIFGDYYNGYGSQLISEQTNFKEFPTTSIAENKYRKTLAILRVIS